MVTEIELEEAVRLMTADLVPLGTELLPVPAALGRTLAEDVTAPIDQPPFDRSPLDGYALRAADTTGASKDFPVRLEVVDTVYAGDVAAVSVRPGQAVKIMTGAMLPPGCDCVVKQEETDRGFPSVLVYRPLQPHDNYVDRGEDYRAGTVLLPAGTPLDAAALGLLASAGWTQAPVRRRPSAAVLSTGDEVAPPGTSPLPAGKIYGANQALLTARLAELGLGRTEGRHVGDDPAAAAAAMAELLEVHDLLITTGGVSVGEKDIFHEALPRLGVTPVFWRVKLKPGTPAMFGWYRGKPVLCLSGNPFAAAATFELLARPLLAALSGEPHLLSQRREAVLESAFPKASPVRRFVRGRMEEGRVTLPEGHSSGQLASLVGCNCLVDLPAGAPPMEAGQPVSVLLL